MEKVQNRKSKFFGNFLKFKNFRQTWLNNSLLWKFFDKLDFLAKHIGMKQCVYVLIKKSQERGSMETMVEKKRFFLLLILTLIVGYQ